MPWSCLRIVRSVSSRVACCCVNLPVLDLDTVGTKVYFNPSPTAHACREHHHPATAGLARDMPGFPACWLLPNTLLVLQIVDLGHAVEASQATAALEDFDIDDLAYLAPETVGSQHQLLQASRCTAERPVALILLRCWLIDMAACKADRLLQ